MTFISWKQKASSNHTFLGTNKKIKFGRLSKKHRVSTHGRSKLWLRHNINYGHENYEHKYMDTIYTFWKIKRLNVSARHEKKRSRIYERLSIYLCVPMSKSWTSHLNSIEPTQHQQPTSYICHVVVKDHQDNIQSTQLSKDFKITVINFLCSESTMRRWEKRTMTEDTAWTVLVGGLKLWLGLFRSGE